MIIEDAGTKKVRSDEKGQALVIVLLVIVIAVVIAFSITYRVIQDLRTTSEERLSEQAGNEVESMLDVVSSLPSLDILWDPAESLGFCEPGEDPCVIDSSNEIEALLGEAPGESKCGDNAKIVIARNLGLDEGIDIKKDEIFEINLSQEFDQSFRIVSWSGSSDTYVEVKVYGNNGSDWVLAAQSLSYSNPYGWGGNISSPASDISWAAPLDQNTVFARIRAVGGDVDSLVITNLSTPQMAVIRASCYIGDVYREFVRVIKNNNALPACFDYVLFDGTQYVKKRA